MNPQLFLAFLVVAGALACTPGVDWAYSITAGLRQRSFVPAVAGLCGGYVLHTVLMVAGLAALLAGMPGVLGWMTVAGAGLPAVAGLQHHPVLARRHLQPPADARSREHRPANQFRTFLQGMGTSGINPKGLLFYVALVPQFVSPEASLPVPVQSGLLGLTFVLLAGARLHLRGAARPETAALPPGAARKVTLASGIIMMALGMVLLSEQLIPVVAGSPGSSACRRLTRDLSDPAFHEPLSEGRGPPVRCEPDDPEVLVAGPVPQIRGAPLDKGQVAVRAQQLPLEGPLLGLIRARPASAPRSVRARATGPGRRAGWHRRRPR